MKTIGILGVAIAALVITTPQTVSASGTYGGGGSGSYSRPQANIDPAARERRLQRRGQRAFLRRITCDDCPYANGVNDVTTARQVASQVRSGEIEMSRRQREALLYFMSRRFGV